MNENYLNTVIYFVMVNLDKTEFKCYETEKLLINENNAQVLFFVSKNNKKYYVVENINFNDNVDLSAKLITKDILLKMNYK